MLFVTARDDEVDRILGLELGADDYVTKPFSPARAGRPGEGGAAPHAGRAGRRAGRCGSGAVALDPADAAVTVAGGARWR